MNIHSFQIKNKRIGAYVLGLIFVLLFASIALKGEKYGKYRTKANKPTLMLVRYRTNENSKHRTEYVSLIDISDIISEEDTKKLRFNHGSPMIYSIGVKGEDLPIISLCPIKLKNSQVLDLASENDSNISIQSKFRFNICCDGELFVYDNIEYHGEEYLHIASGKDWYLGLTTRIN